MYIIHQWMCSVFTLASGASCYYSFKGMRSHLVRLTTVGFKCVKQIFVFQYILKHFARQWQAREC